MRDESASPNVADPAEKTRNSIFLEMKECFLADRTQETALSTFEKLLAMDAENIDADLWLDIKDLLSCLIETITVSTLVTHHQILLLNAINNCPGLVVDYFADLLYKDVEQFETQLATSHVAVAIAFARRITDSQCAESIAKILWRFAHIDAVQNELLSLLKAADSEARFRVHQVAANYVKERGEGSKVAELLRFLIVEISTTDILTQVTAIEMLAETTYQNKSAAEYFFTLGLMDEMYALLNMVAEQPDAGFLFPASMKFFGNLASVDVSCLHRYPNFLRNMFELVYRYDRLDASLRLLALDTFAVVWSDDVAKQFLVSLAGYDIDKAMNMFGVALGSGTLELRIRHIEALTLFLRSDKPVKDEVNEIVKRCWHSLGDGFPPLMVMYLSRPFEQLKLAVLRLIHEVLCYDWAVDSLKNVNGFLDVLLNRRDELNAEGKQLKFDIVCLLVDTKSQHFPPETLMRLKLYRREGAFFVEMVPQLDMANS